MTRLEALRRHALSLPAVCKRIVRWAASDAAISVILDDTAALEGHIRAGARLSLDEVNSLVAPLITRGAKSSPVTEGLIFDVRMIAAYG